MTIDELMEKLKQFSEDGHGDAPVLAYRGAGGFVDEFEIDKAEMTNGRCALELYFNIY